MVVLARDDSDWAGGSVQLSILAIIAYASADLPGYGLHQHLRRHSSFWSVKALRRAIWNRTVRVRSSPPPINIGEVQHQPSPMTADLPLYAVALAQRATNQGRVVIYAGAGISLASPTRLPNGAELAGAIWARLRPMFSALDGVDRGNLLAVADAVAALPGGADALRQAAARAAEFGTAKPSYGHRMIAHLMLEGAIDVLTTNWDDCIERGGSPERLHAVTDERSLGRVTPPSVLKLHGCASEPDSLLITTADLQHPPTWTREQTQARLGSAVVVFLGIGDVAGYVKVRIMEAITDVGDVANIRVVSPGINHNWETSQWAKVAPGLAVENRIAETSDQFMEHLGAAYIHVTLANHKAALAEDPTIAHDLDSSIQALLATDALSLLEWIRQVAVAPLQGESVLSSSATVEALTALGRIAGSSAALSRDRIFDTSDGPIELLVATRGLSARRVEREVENRLSERAANGERRPRFLIAGGIGWSRGKGSLPTDVLNEGNEADILDGPESVVPDIVLAPEVLAS